MAEKYITGVCPNCLATLDYLESEVVVQCSCCDTKIRTTELLNSLSVGRTAPTSKQEEINSLIQTIDNSESGLAYLDSFFATFNWEDYNETSNIYIPSIRTMVDKQKIKHASNPNTWVLEFQSIYLPLSKKVKGLKDFEAKMAENYDPLDNTNVYTYFDNYKKNIQVLVAEKTNVIKTLHVDIKYAEKYGAPEKTINNLKVQLVKINQALSALTPVKELSEVPGLSEIMNKNDKEIADKLLQFGIIAEDVYQRAIQTYSFGANKVSALNEFTKIRGYKDTNSYIAKINRLFNFEGNLYEFGGKMFVPEMDKAATLNVAAMGNAKGKKAQAAQAAANEEEQNRGKTFSLYEIVNGRKSKDAAIKHISAIYASYGGKAFYVKNNNSLCYYDTVSGTETKIDSAKANDYKNAKNEFIFYYTKDKSKFYIKKKLSIKTEKAGCLASLKGNKEIVITNKNNYSVCLIDMANGSMKTIIPETIDIMDTFDDKIFYTYSDDPKSEISNFMMYDINTETKTKVLDENCVIHNVYNNKVIYSLFKPNDYNMNLYSIDLATLENTLLEENIYDYFKTINGKVYYTVGNYAYNPLFSINLDGSERTEIMQNIENISMVRAGWMYVVKGNGINKRLMKISVDGKERITVCERFNTLVKITNGYVYYINYFNEFCIVRNDGLEKVVIAENLNKNDILIDQDYIYYLRSEVVDYKANAVYSKSLYRMDLDGHNVKKIMFNVNNFKEYDENKLYISKSDTVTYEITTPTSKKDSVKTIKTFHLTRYYEYDRLLDKLNVVLTLGLPEEEEYSFKSGCLKKESKVKATYKEIPVKITYERKGVTKAGSNFTEKTTPTNTVNTNSTNQGCAFLNGNGTNNNNNGCGSSSSGCGTVANTKR